MIWMIEYESGETQEEHGTSEQDVRDFIARSYAHMGTVTKIVLHPDYQQEA